MNRHQFDTEFKTTIVNLLHSGHTMKSICAEYDLKEAAVSLSLEKRVQNRNRSF